MHDFLLHVALCDINVMTPLQGMWGGFASDQRSNVKKFLSVVAEMGLPGFSVKDLEEVRLLPFVVVHILKVSTTSMFFFLTQWLV
jgi:hypothetical protein